MKRAWTRAAGAALLLAACGGGAANAPSPAARVDPAALQSMKQPPVDPTTPVRIASGDFHVCALRADGAVRCWGRNKEGQLGDGTIEMRTSPVSVAGVSGATQLALGANFSCALLRDRTVTCWGAGKVWGDGNMRSNVAPTPVAGVRDVVQIDGGGLLLCAVIADGSARCWGGDGGPPAPDASSPPARDAEEVSVAASHACARLRDGTVRCWGDSPWNGTRGVGGTGAPSLAAPPLHDAVRVTTGDTMACVASGSAGVSCWGRNDQGELGLPPDNDWHPQPSRVPFANACPKTKPGEVIELSAGESHACAVVSGDAGCVYCWGSNGDGELGRGTQGLPERPGLVSVTGRIGDSAGNIRGVTALALGADHVCALQSAVFIRDGSGIWCWGSNAQGQLGDGTTARHTSPVRVAW
jgi:hypothetical protein